MYVVACCGHAWNYDELLSGDDEEEWLQQGLGDEDDV
jgi:hypothetical protein